MLPAACAAVCVLLLCSLAGCGGEARSLLWYQDSAAYAELAEGESGRVWRITRMDGGFEAVLTAPASVAGVTFTVTGDTAYAVSGEVKIPVGARMTQGARRAAACLALSEEMLSGIESDPPAGEAWAVLAHFRGADADYAVAVGADGLPLWIEETRAGAVCRFAVRGIGLPEAQTSEAS